MLLISLSPLGHSAGFASCKARCVLISASLPNCPLPQEGGEVRAAALVLLRGFAPQPRSGLLCGINGAAAPVKQGGLRSTALSRCTDATTLTVDDLHGGFAPQPRLVSTVCLTYKINYSIIRGKMQVKFSGENHGFLWQNVK